MARVFVFGSSGTHGAHVEGGGWPGMVKDHLTRLEEGGDIPGCEVFNFASGGQSVKDSLRILKAVADPYRRRHNHVVLEAGLFDSRAKPTPDTYVTTPDEFAEQLRHFKAHTLKVLGFSSLTLVAPHPVSEMLEGQPLHEAHLSYLSNPRIKEFGQVMLDFGHRYELPVHDGFGLFMRDPNWQQDLLYRDGIHPNEAGHAVIYDAVSDPLAEVIRQG